MKPPTSQSLPIKSIGQLLDEIRHAFALRQTQSGADLMERALAQNVQWEALTQAVGEGIDAGIAPAPAS